jgi:hypothetical protein
MINYTGAITLTGDEMNEKHFCLYSEETGGTSNYLISLNPVKIDITNPTTPSIETPIA